MNFVPFQITAHTSKHPRAQSQQENESYLSQRYHLHQWQSAPFAPFPQEVILQLDERINLQAIEFQAVPECEPVPQMQVWICDQSEWRKAGEAINLCKQRVSVLGMGDKLKLVFAKPSHNILAERTVGFQMLKVQGSPLQYFRGVVNHEIERHS